MRRLVCIFLMFFLPLQSFAMQVELPSGGNAFDVAHEVAHLVGASHHHDDDHGAMHYDKSSDSAKHFAEHSASHHCLAVIFEVIPMVAIAPVKVEETDHSHYFPDHFPENPQRPPSSLG